MTRNSIALFFGILTLSTNAVAQRNSDYFNVSVTDVTKNYRLESILPPPDNGGIGCLPTDPGCFPGPLPDPINGGRFDLSTILSIGQRVWDFIINNKPNAEYKTLRASVLPGGATSWSQLKGWSKPVAKVFHVEFKNIFGKSAGGFDYRLVFVHGGSYQGKGKYIGQISFAPLNVKLKTDRQLNVKAELLDALNFGTEEDPIAGAQLLITWHSSTTLKYSMSSIEYFMYGTGELQDITNGSLEQL